MKKILFLLSAMCVWLAANAQYGGAGYFTFGGFYFPQQQNLGTNITGVDAAYPQYGFTIGGGGYSVVKGVVLGGRGTGSIGSKFEVSGQKGEYTFGGGQFDFGYVILANKRFLSFLYLGIGGYTYGVKITNASDSQLDLGSVTIPARSTLSIDYGGFTLAPGFNFTVVRNAFGVSLDVSYIYWTASNTGAVTAGLSLSIGKVLGK